jgi:S1-C subfamily serine protease
MRSTASLIAAIALSIGVATGCGKVAESLSRITEVTQPSGPAPIVTVDPPDASHASDAVVADAARSVVKVRSVAHGCQKILEGSGVVIGPNRVMSAAHAVAGADSFTVSVGDQEHDATVVSYDPNTDIAILNVPELQAPPLAFAPHAAPTGTDAVVLGYPGGGQFVANPARIREVIELTGPDIYRTTSVEREVYVIRGKGGVRQGDSGGPLIDLNGRVLGVVFGAAVDDADTGFVLTAKQVSAQAATAVNTVPVATGACVS